MSAAAAQAPNAVLPHGQQMEATIGGEIPWEMVGVADGIARREEPQSHSFASRTFVSFAKSWAMAGCFTTVSSCWDNTQEAPLPWLPPLLPPVLIFSPLRTVAWNLPLQGLASGQFEPLVIINMATKGLCGFQGPKKFEAWKRYDWLHNTKKKTAALTSVNISLNANVTLWQFH